MAGQIEIIFTNEFRKSYKKLPVRIQEKVKKQIRFLESNQKHPSLKIHRLNNVWEFYIDVYYRCFFQRDDNKFTLLIVGTHKIVDRYKKH